MNTDELEKLFQLKEKGIISDEEFQAAKEKILGKQSNGNGFDIPEVNLEDEETQKKYVMFLHLSVLLGSFIPWLGYIAPFIMWFVKKDSIPRIDRHGRVVINWVLSSILFSVISTILVLAFGLGILLLGILWIANIVFSIMGAIKANDGELWPYPGSIQFFTIPSSDNKTQKHLDI